MLKLVCDGEEAHIDDSGIVDYFEFRGDALVVTEAPSQTIMQMVLALMPFVGFEVVRAEAEVALVKSKMQAATDKVVAADCAEYAAQEAGQTARTERIALSQQLRNAEASLQLARVPQSAKTWREQYNRNNQAQSGVSSPWERRG